MSLLLDKHERDKFAHYLRVQNQSDKTILEQHEKIMPGPLHEAYAKRQKVLMVARQIVIDELMRVEDDSVGPTDVGKAPDA